MTARLNDFESAAAGAGEREKRAWEKLQASNTRMAATIAALDALKAELGDANAGLNPISWYFFHGHDTKGTIRPSLACYS